MKFLIRDRQQGKTTDLIEWVKQGEKTNRYPGWSRILVAANMQRADQLRGGDPTDPNHPTGLEYQQVFFVDELLNAHRIDPDVELALDDADTILQGMFRNRVGITAATGDFDMLNEVDRCARAYGWEIGQGNTPEGPFDGVVASPKNPFNHKDWRERLKGETS